MPLWIPSAAAESSVQMDDWQGGAVAGGLLTVADGAATFSPGAMASFELTLFGRLAAGNGVSLAAGSAVVVLNYTPTGGGSLGETRIPFPADELAWAADAADLFEPVATWETGGMLDPDVVAWNGGYLLYYGTDGGQIGVATSRDLETWTRYADPVLAGDTPAAATDGTTLVLYYGCAAGLCSAVSTDGLGFEDQGTLVDGAADPTATVDDAGVWHLWYTGIDGARLHDTSVDGVVWAGPEASSDRLVGLDAVSGAYGFEGVYTVGDGFGWARGGADPDFLDTGSDIVPVLGEGDAPWSTHGLGTASIVVEGTTPHLYYAGISDTSVIGHAVAVPAPGTWGGLTVRWDGTTCTAQWNGGPAMAVALDAADTFTLTADGTFEVSEVMVSWTEPGAGDTAGDTSGDTSADSGAGTGRTRDTAALDSTASDTALVDTAVTDTSASDTGGLVTAAQEYGEPGGFGCATVSATGSLGALLVGLLPAGLLSLRRRR